jgi:hypothetical protein
MPTSVLKQVVDLIAPYVVELFNRSLAAGHYPAGFKEAFITPIVKKAGLDTTDVGSYRPISNFELVGPFELLEPLVVCQLTEYLASACLLRPSNDTVWFPTGSFDRNHRPPVPSELLQAADRRDLGALILLDLTAALDTVDYDILLPRLQQTFGVDGITHRWFRSYLLGRTQYYVAVLPGQLLLVCCRRGRRLDRCRSFCIQSISSH